MINFEQLKISADVLIPVIITLFGFLSYYFGKIISETSIGIEEKSQNYIFGFMFALNYIALPVAVIYYFRSFLVFNLKWGWGIAFFVLLSFIITFFKNKQNVFEIQKGQAYEEFESEAIKRITNVFNWIKLRKNEGFIAKVLKRYFSRLPSRITLQILTFVELFLIASLANSTNLIFGVLLFIWFLTSMANVAQLVTAKGINYPEVLLIDKDGKEYRGRIIKYGKEFVSLRNKREVYNFVRENVSYVFQKENISFDKRGIGKIGGEHKNE